MQKLTCRSSNMLKLIFFVTAIRLLLLSSSLTMAAVVSKRGNVQLCGRMLTQTLSLICEGQYYDPGEQNVISKRDISQQPTDDVFSGWYLGFPSQQINQMSHHPYPQYSSQYPPQFQSNHRMERGVVDECCKKPCSLAVLMSYCRSA